VKRRVLLGLAVGLALLRPDFAPVNGSNTKPSSPKPPKSSSSSKPSSSSRSTSRSSSSKSQTGRSLNQSGRTTGSQRTNPNQPSTTRTSFAAMTPAMQHNQAFMRHVRFHELAVLMALHHHHHWWWHHWAWGYWPLGAYGMAGNVVGVPSGDSLLVNNGAGQTQRVRLFGVSAPTSGPVALQSQQHLARLQGKFVHVHSVSSDPDGSTVAKVFYAGSYVNQDQIASGMAVNSLDHGLDQTLANAEQTAQEEGKGMWAEGDFALAD
jgi:endonuclease YncB( thermonuclease family)